MPITFVHPGFLLLTLLALPLITLWSRRQTPLGFSHLRLHKSLRRVPLVAMLPPVLFFLAFGSMSAALARPQVSDLSAGKTAQARDVLFAVDISTNMTEPYSDSFYSSSNGLANPPGGSIPTQGCGNVADWGQRKIDLASYAVCYFAVHSKNDRMGLAEFDGNVYWSVPLVADPQIVQRKSYLLNQYVGDGNVNFDGPTASPQGGPGVLQEALDYLKEHGQAQTRVLVIITDGDGSINGNPADGDVTGPNRFAALVAEARQLGIQVYGVGVGADSLSGDPQSNDLNSWIAAVHGTIIDAASQKQMNAMIQRIDNMPASTVKLEQQAGYLDLYQYFLVAALVLWLLFLAAHALTRQTT